MTAAWGKGGLDSASKVLFEEGRNGVKVADCASDRRALVDVSLASCPPAIYSDDVGPKIWI